MGLTRIIYSFWGIFKPFSQTIINLPLESAKVMHACIYKNVFAAIYNAIRGEVPANSSARIYGRRVRGDRNGGAARRGERAGVEERTPREEKSRL
jgi:hypothetical protein